LEMPAIYPNSFSWGTLHAQPFSLLKSVKRKVGRRPRSSGLNLLARYDADVGAGGWMEELAPPAAAAETVSMAGSCAGGLLLLTRDLWRFRI